MDLSSSSSELSDTLEHGHADVQSTLSAGATGLGLSAGNKHAQIKTATRRKTKRTIRAVEGKKYKTEHRNRSPYRVNVQPERQTNFHVM